MSGSSPRSAYIISIGLAGAVAVGLQWASSVTPEYKPGLNGVVLPMVAGFGLFNLLKNLADRRRLQAGNRSVSVASAEARAATLAFAPVPGQGRVVVIRPGRKEGRSSVGVDLLIDDTPRAQLMTQQFVVLPLPVGPHRLFADIPGAPGASPQQPITPVLGEGSIIFYEMRTVMGLMRASLRLDPLPDTPELRARLAKATLVEPLVAAV